MLVKRLLALMDTEEKSITIANGLLWVSAAWKKLSSVMLKTVFKMSI